MRVVVTGASRGIGRGIATVLARAGHAVGATARSAGLLESLAKEIRDAGGTCETAPADLRSAGETSGAIDALVERLGGVDALVANAGLVRLRPILETTPEEWRTLLETNVTGAFHATRAVLPRLVEQGSGHLVFVSSISGTVPLPGGAAYAATKHALTGFAGSLMLELRDRGVKVTTVFPGSVDTESHRDGRDTSWKLRPVEVGEAVRSVLETRAGNLISRVEIRPRVGPGR